MVLIASTLPQLQVTSVKPQEVKRIFTMGLPFTSHHGGQILFGPENGYLYFMMGDGGSLGDPYNFAQNKKSLLGKIIRLDIDNISRKYWKMCCLYLCLCLLHNRFQPFAFLFKCI